jgi:hypothetical protein
MGVIVPWQEVSVASSGFWRRGTAWTGGVRSDQIVKPFDLAGRDQTRTMKVWMKRLIASR